MGTQPLFKYVDTRKDYHKNTKYRIKSVCTINDLSNYERNGIGIDINNLTWRYLHYNNVKCENENDVIKILITLLTPFMEKCRHVYGTLDGQIPYDK